MIYVIFIKDSILIFFSIRFGNNWFTCRTLCIWNWDPENHIRKLLSSISGDDESKDIFGIFSHYEKWYILCSIWKHVLSYKYPLYLALNKYFCKIVFFFYVEQKKIIISSLSINHLEWKRYQDFTLNELFSWKKNSILFRSENFSFFFFFFSDVPRIPEISQRDPWSS